MEKNSGKEHEVGIRRAWVKYGPGSWLRETSDDHFFSFDLGLNSNRSHGDRVLLRPFF